MLLSSCPLRQPCLPCATDPIIVQPISEALKTLEVRSKPIIEALKTLDVRSKPVKIRSLPSVGKKDRASRIFQVTRILPSELVPKINFILHTYRRIVSQIDGILPINPMINRVKMPDIVSRRNYRYDIGLDRIVLMTGSRSKLTSKKIRRLIKVLEKIRFLLRRNIHVEIIELYYSIPKLGVTVETLSKDIDDIACILHCTRASLNLTTSSKGCVAGMLTFKDGDKVVDCRQCDRDGIGIHDDMDRVTLVESEALFILVVEHKTVFKRLVQDRFHEKIPCIILCGCGKPSVSTRMFLQKLANHFNQKPVIALVNCNLRGIKTLCSYSLGSKKMAYDSKNLTTRGIWWLGLRPSHVEELGIPKKSGKKMTIKQIDKVREWVKKPHIQSRPAWVEELEKLAELGTTYDMLSLHAFDIQYIANQYLPEKLLEKDLI